MIGNPNKIFHFTHKTVRKNVNKHEIDDKDVLNIIKNKVAFEDIVKESEIPAEILDGIDEEMKEAPFKFFNENSFKETFLGHFKNDEEAERDPTDEIQYFFEENLKI